MYRGALCRLHQYRGRRNTPSGRKGRKDECHVIALAAAKAGRRPPGPPQGRFRYPNGKNAASHPDRSAHGPAHRRACQPVVKKGDHVDVGTLVGKARRLCQRRYPLRGIRHCVEAGPHLLQRPHHRGGHPARRPADGGPVHPAAPGGGPGELPPGRPGLPGWWAWGARASPRR